MMLGESSKLGGVRESLNDGGEVVNRVRDSLSSRTIPGFIDRGVEALLGLGGRLGLRSILNGEDLRELTDAWGLGECECECSALEVVAEVVVVAEGRGGSFGLDSSDTGGRLCESVDR